MYIYLIYDNLVDTEEAVLSLNNSSKSADSAKGDIDGIMVGGIGLKMIDVDALPRCAHRLVLEHVIHPSVESIEIDW